MSEANQAEARKALLRQALSKIDELQAKLSQAEQSRDAPIAVVGVGCRFPGEASTPERYWRNLADGLDLVTEVPAERWDNAKWYDPDPDAPGKTYSRHGGFIGKVDGFDAAFFGIAPRDAVHMDPQHRLLLECAWEALERAGLPADRLTGSRTGVFVGITSSDYGVLVHERETERELDAYYHFVQRNVQEYTNDRVPLSRGDQVRFIQFMASHGLSAHTVASIFTVLPGAIGEPSRVETRRRSSDSSLW